MVSKLVQSGNWFMLPLSPPATATTITISGVDTPEQARKRAVMSNLYQVGVIFKHKRSKVLWEVVEVEKSEDGIIRWAWCKSHKSGYKKAFYPDEYHYDSLILHECPDALRVLFGDEKHGKVSISNNLGTPQEAEQAFDIELTEDEISENDPG